MGKGDSKTSSMLRAGRSSLNSGAPWPSLFSAEERVLDHPRKLHRWARTEPARRFDDVFNLVCDRATLLVAWERVSNNRGAKTAGVDAMTRYAIKDDDVVPFLDELRSKLKDGSFTPLPVRQTTIPKKGGKRRVLGIPTVPA
jgi:RNA-directed DNA polymerase